jgi:hypothetical protein
MRRIAAALWARLKRPIVWRRRHLYDFPLTGDIPHVEPRIPIRWVVKEHPDWPAVAGQDGSDGMMLFAEHKGVEIYYSEVITNLEYIRRFFPACDLGPRPLYHGDAVTHPDYRGNLLHPAGMTFVYHHYRERGYERAFCRVRLDNAASHSGMARAGYRLCAVAHHVTVLGVELKPFGRRLRHKSGRKAARPVRAALGTLCFLLLSFGSPGAQEAPSDYLPERSSAPQTAAAPGEASDYYVRDAKQDMLLVNVEKYHLSEDNFWKQYRARAYPSATAELRFALKYFPNHPRALYLMEILAKDTANPSLAIRAYERALQLFPQHPYTRAQYGAYLVRIGATAAGIQELRTAIAADSTLYVARATLASALQNAKGRDGSNGGASAEAQGSGAKKTPAPR